MLRILQYYFEHTKKHWLSGILVYVFYSIGIILGTTVTPILYKEIIDTISQGVTDETVKQAMFYFWIVVALAIIGNFMYRIADYLITYFQSRILENITNDAFERIHKHSTNFFNDNFAGSLVTKVKRLVSSFENAHDSITWNIWFTFVATSSIMVVLFLTSSILGFAFLIWTIIYIIITFLFIKKKRPLELAKAEQDSLVTGKIADTFTNFLNIKMFAARKKEYSLFSHATQKERILRDKAWNFQNFMNLSQSILLLFVLDIGMMYIALTLWKNGSITVGTVVLVQSYAIAMFGYIWNLGKGFSNLASAFNDAKEMLDIFDQDIDVKDPHTPEKCTITNGEVVFDKVSFSYNSQKSVFEAFDLTIKPGERIGLVGHSGAGKTTIIKLLLRFTDVTSGSVRIDGQDIAKITQDDLRKNISYVPQEPLLFHRSLRENILYGKPDATEEELLAATKKAHAHEFITSLPDGYETLVGERGVKLSGGERQRVAIARAMLKDAPLLILDEATSALDSISEEHIQKAFEALMKNRTTIVIAHRLSTIQKMDRIIVLDDGNVVEEGTHTELTSRQNGIYKTFWQSQAGQFISD